MTITIDESDPCAAALALRQALVNLVAGRAAQRIVFRAGPNGVQRETQFHEANVDALKELLREYEDKCAKAQGKGPRRYAMRAGGRL